MKRALLSKAREKTKQNNTKEAKGKHNLERSAFPSSSSVLSSSEVLTLTDGDTVKYLLILLESVLSFLPNISVENERPVNGYLKKQPTSARAIPFHFV